MKLTLASIAVLAFTAVAAPSFAQSTSGTTVVCPPNGNSNSAGIVGKGNQVGAGSGTAAAGTASSSTDCPTGQGPAAPATATSGGAAASGGSIAVTPATSNSSNGMATNK